jgi:hypothetical protein
MCTQHAPPVFSHPFSRRPKTFVNIQRAWRVNETRRRDDRWFGKSLGRGVRVALKRNCVSVLLTGDDGVSTAAVATVAVQGQRAAVAEWSTATVAQWLISPGPNGPGCAAAVAAAAERASFDGPALLELHALWTGAGAAAGADVSSGRDFAMDILREEMGLTRVGERLRVFHRLRAAAGE